jgi:hypothetical protein
VLELDDGARLFVRNRALRVASAEVTARLLRGEPVAAQAVCFRCQPAVEAADPRWQWLSERQFVGTGGPRPDSGLLSFYCVL